MKYYLFLLLLIPYKGKSQQWMAEAMAGVSSYNGDLTQSAVASNRLGPCAALNIKYNSPYFWSLRAGISYGRISGDDNKNKDEGLQSRNLSFKSHVIELSVCGELAVVDPELYYSYPYIFGGVGVFHFNPYTTDNENKKIFLQPLGTEGQGLSDYPSRKKYSLFQLSIPFGAGWKFNYRDKYEISYEFGYRLLFTDYLDDVSKTYVPLENLAAGNGPKAAELSYRKKTPFMEAGEARGNSKVKDMYFFSGFKIAAKIGKNRHERSYNY